MLLIPMPYLDDEKVEADASGTSSSARHLISVLTLALTQKLQSPVA
jgi:hypothetical protein